MISEPLARWLAAGRPELNRRVAETRRRLPGFDIAAFGDFLAIAVDPVVCAADAHAPERTGSVAMAAFDAALALTAHGHAHAPSPVAQGDACELAGHRHGSAGVAGTVWRQLVPLYARLLCQQPAAVLGMLTNAALHVQRQRGARASQWQAIMTQLAPQIENIAHLRAVGQVAAWRAGMAHFRQGAITVADGLPEPLAMAAFGMAAESWPALRAALLLDPWWTPDAAQRERLQAGIEIGGFTGLGGEFGEPPHARPAPHGFWVRSGERHALLIADACGAVLHPATAEEYEHPEAAPDARISVRGAELSINGRTVQLDLPAEQLQVVCNRHAVAITSPYTHAIRVLPL